MSQSDIRNHALWLLGSREHSTYEMRQKLSRKGFEEDSITQVIEDLTSLNYLSDQRFAEAFAEANLPSHWVNNVF
ncbi:regulatory protein RecX [Marinomonas fungiae]|uniref:regulatory protein RecX n=1 Tax=Marinomonas fungiae TaxID=1137284 RepID=UPI003A95C68F